MRPGAEAAPGRFFLRPLPPARISGAGGRSVLWDIATRGKVWESYNKPSANQRALKLENLKGCAQEIGLDMERFAADLSSLDNKKRVDEDRAEAGSIGVTGTPGFFVNGRYLRGAKPFEEFAKPINTELARQKLPIPEEARGM